jgi:hypothetical protein
MGRLAAYVAGEVGCRNYPRRRLAASARDRRRLFGFHPKSPILPHPAKGLISEPVANRYHGRF